MPALRSHLIACTLAFAAGAASLPAQGPMLPPLPEKLSPSEDNFEEWLAFIRPNEDERRYEEIGWRNTFWPAVEEARKLGRPILLWTMNGHPLGCT